MCRKNGLTCTHTHVGGVSYALAGSPDRLRDLDICVNEPDGTGRICGVVANHSDTVRLGQWVEQMQAHHDPNRRLVCLIGNAELIQKAGAKPFDNRQKPGRTRAPKLAVRTASA